MNSASRGLRPAVGLRRPGGIFCVGEGRRLARQRLGRPISIGAEAFGRRSACADREVSFASAKADARRASAWEGRFQSAQKPSASGRPARRMNSASRGLRPAVGLRRPGGIFCVGEGRRPARQRLGRPISIGAEAFGRRSACADREVSFASAKADARRASAWEGRFQSAQKPSASGRPARRMNSASRGLRPAVGLRRPGGIFCVGEGRRPARQRLGGPISIGAKAFGQRSACTPNEFGLQGPSAGGRPAPTGRYLLRRRRPTPGAPAPWKADFNRRRSLRPAVGLRRPGRGFASAEADARRASALEGRFQSA
jgi:hypothetical protein